MSSEYEIRAATLRLGEALAHYIDVKMNLERSMTAFDAELEEEWEKIRSQQRRQSR